MSKHRTNVKELLAHATPFQALDEQQLVRLSAGTRIIRAAADNEIVAPGDVAVGAFWLVYGQIKIVFSPKKGTERTVEILGDGACFGIAEMLTEHPHLAAVKTCADSLILHVERATLLELIGENSAFSRDLMLCVSRQFCGLMRDVECYTQTARQRLAGYLLKQRRLNNCDNFELSSNREIISSLLWLTPETISRVLHDFSAENIIDVSGRKVSILDSEKMTEALVGGE
ncbi:MAG TPA: Crp/Fnr family transcriptional regulator [Burkholderiaceae bacterium]|jgi:CRP-like cAMP-binding protein